MIFEVEVLVLRTFFRLERPLHPLLHDNASTRRDNQIARRDDFISAERETSPWNAKQVFPNEFNLFSRFTG
jgi:hypothetical protein